MLFYSGGVKYLDVEILPTKKMLKEMSSGVAQKAITLEGEEDLDGNQLTTIHRVWSDYWPMIEVHSGGVTIKNLKIENQAEWGINIAAQYASGEAVIIENNVLKSNGNGYGIYIMEVSFEETKILKNKFFSNRGLKFLSRM